MFCLKCGKEIPDESNYCLYCGVLVSKSNINSLVKTEGSKSLVDIECKKEFGWNWYKIKIYMDGNFIKDVKNGGSVSFEIENGKHIIYCEAAWCKRSDAIEIIANSNVIKFSVAFPPAYFSYEYKLIITKTKETDANTWEQ
jgi:hypothetical protein